MQFLAGSIMSSYSINILVKGFCLMFSKLALKGTVKVSILSVCGKKKKNTNDKRVKAYTCNVTELC